MRALPAILTTAKLVEDRVERDKEIEVDVPDIRDANAPDRILRFALYQESSKLNSVANHPRNLS